MRPQSPRHASDELQALFQAQAAKRFAQARLAQQALTSRQVGQNIPAEFFVPRFPSLRCLAELAGVWEGHRFMPELMRALHLALADPLASSADLACAHAAIARSLKLSHGGYESFLHQGPDSEAAAEIAAAIELFPHNSDLLALVDDILSDGHASPQELIRLRSLLDAVQNFNLTPPRSNPLPSFLRFPTLDLRPPLSPRKTDS